MARITEIRRFRLDNWLQSPVIILFANRKGGVDEVQFTKFKDTELKTSPQLYGSYNTEKTYTVDSKKTNTYYSRVLTEAEFNWLQDLFLSPDVTVNGKYVKVLGSTYKFDQVERLFTIELTVAPPHEENKISL